MRARVKDFNKSTAAFLVALAALVAGWSYASAQADPPRGGTSLARLAPAQAVATPTEAIEDVDPEVTEGFALFRDQAPTPMPAELAERLASPHRFGRNAGLARAIDTANGPGWVVPGDGYLCLAVPDPVSGYGVGCTSVPVALEQGLWVRLRGEGPGAEAVDTLVLPLGKDAVVHGSGGDQTLHGSATGVVSEQVAVDASTPALIPDA